MFGGGAARFDRDAGAFENFPSDPAVAESLSSPRVTAFAEDASGALWIGTQGGGLNRFDEATGTIERYLHDPADAGSLSHDWVRTLYEDRDGRLWLASHDGRHCPRKRVPPSRRR